MLQIVSMKKEPAVELMAPAGSKAALSAAINAGADSVYFGIGKLNMRARSADFGPTDLLEIARQCNQANVKSYLALNTIVYDNEFEEMQSLCDAAKSANVSAVIATDIATIEYAHSIGMEVHISVQANVANFEALKFYSRYADTIVLARELTLQQIASIHRQTVEQNVCGPSGKPIRLELFGHGALCVAISGKCYMSLAQYNASANRGACFQTCRRAYRITDEETGEELMIDNKHVMSPKDLCTVQYLDQIADAGISVLKIEGRARTADYIAITTRVYREALDALADGSYDPNGCEEWIERLASVFNRGFWHGGYYCGKKLGDWAGSSHSQATEKRDQIGTVSNFFGKLSVTEFPLIKHSIKNGDPLLIEGPTTGAIRFTTENLHVDGKPAECAKPGNLVTLKTPAKVRRQDKVFLLTPIQKYK
jgi:putative protease